MVGWLFKQLEQTVGGLFHECGRREDGECALGFGGLAVIGDVNGLTDLAELDHELRRVGRNDQHVRVRLDEDARLALVGFAQIVAGVDGFIDKCFEVGGGCDADAVGADAAEIGQAIGLGGPETVDGLGEHEGERVFACAARTGQDHGVGKAAGTNAFAQVRDGGRVAEEVLESHELSLTVDSGQ